MFCPLYARCVTFISWFYVFCQRIVSKKSNQIAQGYHITKLWHGLSLWFFRNVFVWGGRIRVWPFLDLSAIMGRTGFAGLPGFRSAFWKFRKNNVFAFGINVGVMNNWFSKVMWMWFIHGRILDCIIECFYKLTVTDGMDCLSEWLTYMYNIPGLWYFHLRSERPVSCRQCKLLYPK